MERREEALELMTKVALAVMETGRSSAEGPIAHAWKCADDFMTERAKRLRKLVAGTPPAAAETTPAVPDPRSAGLPSRASQAWITADGICRVPEFLLHGLDVGPHKGGRGVSWTQGSSPGVIELMTDEAWERRANLAPDPDEEKAAAPAGAAPVAAAPGVLWVYISGPYSGGNVSTNVRNAIKAGAEVRELGHVPVIPHLFLLADLIKPQSYDHWLKFDLEYLQRCDALFRLPGFSSGSEVEVKAALAAGKPVFRSLDELKAARSTR